MRGQVSTLGVYELPAGSAGYRRPLRTSEWIPCRLPAKAGLFLESGPGAREDGMKIQVPDRDQAEGVEGLGLTQSGISMGGGTAGVSDVR